MTIKGVLPWILFLAVSVLPAVQLSAAARPNILFITFDTTRSDGLSPYGNKESWTPHTQKLADEGVLFENVYAQAPQTLPNHVSIFTGLYTITHNVLSNGQKLDEAALTLAEILKEYNYNTGAIVSAAPLMKVFNLDQGFDHYDDDFAALDLLHGFKSFLRFFSANKINMQSDRKGHETARLAVRWIERASKRKKPFFLWVHFFDPHKPYDYRPDFGRPEIIENLVDLTGHERARVAYANEVQFADHNMGKVLAALETLGIAERTLTVFTADHGESLGEHGYLGHRQHVYENIIRVPFIIRWPQHLPFARRIAAPTMSIDIVPTLLSLLEIPYLPGSFQGRDMLAVQPQQPRRLYSLAVKLFTKTPIRRMMIYGDYKFIEFDQPERNALYDIHLDPLEQVNLLDDLPPEALQVQWQEGVQQWWDQHSSLLLSDFKMTREQLERLKSLGYVQ
jgi:arylsulfatase A-like enzyme